MFRVLSSVAVAVVLIGCAGSTDSPTSPLVVRDQAAALRSQQMATGSGTFANLFTTGSFEVAAHSDPGGSNPRGNAGVSAIQQYPFPNFEARGPVTCLAVSANRAAVGFKVHEGNVGGSDIAGQGLIIIVEDNGPPGLGHPDGFTNSGFFPDGDNLPCADYLAQAAAPVTSGNVEVK